MTALSLTAESHGTERPNDATINGVRYVVEAYIARERMAVDHPRAAAHWLAHRIVGMAILRRPRGRKQYLAYRYAAGGREIVEWSHPVS